MTGRFGVRFDFKNLMRIALQWGNFKTTPSRELIKQNIFGAGSKQDVTNKILVAYEQAWGCQSSFHEPAGVVVERAAGPIFGVQACKLSARVSSEKPRCEGPLLAE